MGSAPKRRTIFFISDSTAITAETLGQSLLTQFEPLEFEQVTLPFVDTFSKAGRALMQINKDANTKGIRPIVFSTLINPDIRRLFKNSSCIFFDFFDTFISRLESELDMRSSHTIGRYHGLVDDSVYNVRIDAMNYAIDTDDGISTKDYDRPKSYLLGCFPVRQNAHLPLPRPAIRDLCGQLPPDRRDAPQETYLRCPRPWCLSGKSFSG